LVQKDVGPSAVIVGVPGNAFTVTTVATDAALWHPLILVTFTV
jgi:serine acetyltransferase